MPVFSIIVPVYNVAPWLRECLDSIVAQTFADWECVCVDDGSTDGSGAILDEYAEKDHRFRIIHQTNAGVSVARNRALDVIMGTYFTYVDSDDAIVPDTLECFADVFSKTGADALLCWPTSNLVPIDAILSEPTGYNVLLARTTPLSILAGRFTANGYPFLRGYKTSLFRNVRFQQGLTVMEDARYQADCLCVDAVWTIIQKRYYAYRRERPGSATKANSPRHFIRWVEALAYTTGKMRDNMGASERDVRKFAREWGPVYARRAVHPAFRIWSRFSRDEQQEWWSVLQKCRSNCGFWPFRWTDRIRFCAWRYHLDTILFPPLLLIDRIPGALRWRLCRLRVFLAGKRARTTASKNHSRGLMVDT